MTALAMVIFNHILSRISRPESGNCITLTMVAMSVLLADRGKSSNSGMGEEVVRKHWIAEPFNLFKCRKVIVITTELMFHSMWWRCWLAVFTVVWVRSCQGGGVRNPGCRVNGSHWLSWTNATNKATLIKDSLDFVRFKPGSATSVTSFQM